MSTHSATTLAFVTHLHHHGEKDKDYKGFVVHALPGNLTAWGKDIEAAYKNFDAMLRALHTDLGNAGFASWWKGMYDRMKSWERDAWGKLLTPDDGPPSVRSVGSTLYLASNRSPERMEHCEPCS